MNNDLPKTQLVDRVLGKLRSGQVKMKPRAHFVLKTLLIILGVITVALFVLYLISFISFALRASGAWFLPGFGFRGFGFFITSFPWILFLAAALLIAVLEILVKHFSFTYRRPILYSVLVIIVLAALGSFVIDKTQLHSALFQRAQEGRLPFAGEFYRGFGGMPEVRGMYRGVVSEITDDGFSLEAAEGQTLRVVVTSETRFPFGTGIEEGDTVMVLGEEDNDTIRAFGISKIDDDLGASPQDHGPGSRNMIVPRGAPAAPGQ